MSVETIGLRAVLEQNDFQQGVMQYLTGINKMTGETKRVASRIASDFVNLGQGVLRFGAIAGGAALLGVGALTAGIVALGGTALEEYAKFERLSLSVQSLVARELAQGKLVEEQRQVIAQLTAKEAQELENLQTKIAKQTASRNTLSARIQEQRQRVIEMTTQWGEEGLATQTAKARLAEMELQYQQSGEAIGEMQGRVEELNARNGELVTVIEKVRVGQMDMASAMEEASPRAQELLKWIQLLAVQSPFDQEGVAVAFRTALAYGFTSEEAQRLTEAQIDFASATGQGVEVMNLIALALGQMQAKGKVSGQELIQLTNAGIGVNQILGNMGFTLDDVSNGLVDADEFIEAVIQDMEIFKGSAKEQSTTFSGLLNSLSDLKAIGLREFFTGTFQAIQPHLATFVDMLTRAGLETGQLREMGDVLGGVVAGGLERIGELVSAFQTGGAGGLLAALGITPEAVTLFNLIRDSAGGLAEIVSGQLAPAMGDFQGIIPTLNMGIEFAVEHFDELQGALIGIGAILGAGIFAALVAGLFSLLTPINLIIAGAALLGAAWAGNWFGIQDAATSAWEVIGPIFGDIVDGVLEAISLFSSGDIAGGFTALGDTAAGAIRAAWPIVSEALIGWRDKFFDWVVELYPQIPTFLTYLVGGVAGFLTDNWPAISEALFEWSDKFWDWVKNAAAGTAAAMAALAIAMLAWAFSGEGQTSMNELGHNLGVAITDAIKLFFEAKEGTDSALLSLAQGLLAGVAGILGTLVIVGGEITAGILSGILESLGVDLEPTTFSELSGILTGIGSNIVTIASLIGENIITGITDGIRNFQQNLEDELFKVAMNAIDAFKSFFGIESPSTVFFGFGMDLIQGLIDGISSLAGNLPSLLSEIGGGILSSLFGGGGEAEGAEIDTTAMINGLTQVQLLIENITNASLPNLFAAWAAGYLQMNIDLTALNVLLMTIAMATLMLLMTQMTNTANIMITQFLMVHLRAEALNQLLMSIYLVTLVALAAATVQTGSTMVTAFVSVQEAVATTEEGVISLGGEIETLGQTTDEAMEEASKAFEKATEKIEDLIEVTEEATEAAEKMAEAYKKAAEAAQSAGSSSGQAGGVGFSHGLGFAGGLGLGFKVPEGYPDDSFGPLYVESGEEMLIAPRGMSIESILMDKLGATTGGMSPAAVSKTVVVDIGDIYIMNDTDVNDLERRIIRAVGDEM